MFQPVIAVPVIQGAPEIRTPLPLGTQPLGHLRAACQWRNDPPKTNSLHTGWQMSSAQSARTPLQRLRQGRGLKASRQFRSPRPELTDDEVARSCDIERTAQPSPPNGKWWKVLLIVDLWKPPLKVLKNGSTRLSISHEARCRFDKS